MLPKLKLQPHLLSNVPLGSAVCSPPGLRTGAKTLTPPAKILWRRDTGSTSPYPRSWSRQGRNSSFSRQVQPSLGDTSLDSLKRRTRSISNCLQRFQARRLEVETIIRARERKKRLAELLRRRFGIKFSLLDLKTLSEDAMTRRAVERRSWHLAQVAAGQMIAWVTRARISRSLHSVHAREHMAAFCIQKQWKRYTVTAT